MDGNNRFKYTYSAPTEEERLEIEGIRRQYDMKKGADKLTRLRSLDAKVRNLPTAVSIALGVVGILVFGLGLTCILEWSMLSRGIVLAALGVLPIAIAYPVHSALTRHYKKKHGQEIIQLSDELLSKDGAE